MTKKELIDSLNEIYNDLDNFPNDTTLYTACKDISKIGNNLGDIIQQIEDDGIDKEEVEEE